MDTKLYLVLPCYNEADALTKTAAVLAEKMHALIDTGEISSQSRVVFVNDGSTDTSWQIICELHGADPLFSGIDLSRNRGHQNALLAGLLSVADAADACISLDADLQDDVNVIDDMLAKYRDGCDVVYGVRRARRSDTVFKRTTARAYYRLMAAAGAELVYNHADCRLLSRRALKALGEFREVNLFLRGLVPLLGYKSDVVYYDRQKRIAGKSKYSLRKMLSLAADGITSFSVAPVRLVLNSGVFVFVAALAALVWLAVVALHGGAVAGWAWVLVSVWLAAGLILSACGILGEYIARTYLESKQRPRFIVRENLK